MNYEVKKEKWQQFFENIGKRRYEWMTEVEVLNPDLGDQTLAKGLPLNGITLETVGDTVSIDISVGQSPAHHLTHTIKNPTKVGFLAGEGVRDDIVDIEEADGTKTLIRLTEPMGILVGIMDYEYETAVM